MRKMIWKILFTLLAGLMLTGSTALATQLDLSGFSGDPTVSVTGNVVDFAEDINLSNVYYLNDTYQLADNATILSFNYDFTLGPDDEWDYFTFELNGDWEFPELEVDTTVSTGYFEIDLSAYQGQEISIAWALNWDGDDYAETTASIYNIDLATADASPTPEPATFFLFGIGLLGLAGASRKKALS